MNSAVGRVFKESFVEEKMFVGSLWDPLESLKSLLKRPSQKKKKKKKGQNADAGKKSAVPK